MSQVNAGSASIDLKVTGANQAQAEVKKVESELKSLDVAADSANNLRQVLSNIALPVALGTAVTKLLTQIDETRAAVAQLNAEMAKVGTDAVTALADVGRPDLGALDSSLRDVQQRTATTLQQISDDALKRTLDIQHRTVPGMLWNFVFGGETENDVVAAATRTTNAVINASEQAAERLRERQRERDAKAAQDAETKRQSEDAAAVEQLEASYQRALELQIRLIEKEKEEKEKAHRDELDRIQREHDARMRNARELSEELQRIREQQESGFTAVDLGGGAGLRGSIMARFGRGNGRG